MESAQLDILDIATAELHDLSISETPAKSTKKLCKFFQYGKCRNGDECPFLHELYSARKKKPPPSDETAITPEAAAIAKTDKPDSSPVTPDERAPPQTPSSQARRQRKQAKLEGAHAVASPALSLDGTPTPKPKRPHYLWKKHDWGDLPEWIVLSDERGKARPFPPLSEDPLFTDDGGPLLLPFDPPAGARRGKGAAVVVPGGNLEFLHPREGCN